MIESELHNVVGGISYSAINAVARVLEFLLDAGRRVGSAIRRYRNGTAC